MATTVLKCPCCEFLGLDGVEIYRHARREHEPYKWQSIGRMTESQMGDRFFLMEEDVP